ncbi:hypothetical protein NECAME_01803 [Necator americanus]|uniref:Uncharacterized protein n=1 Tax=Necator americanus TaxID=51031 RepID=W2TQU8_NECAM|nr:hypothetical protein NECAME_01803 [Necator americanus]ETN83496.1 hypothetical protein NECAME_01803 [Necator americanus]
MAKRYIEEMWMMRFPSCPRSYTSIAMRYTSGFVSGHKVWIVRETGEEKASPSSIVEKTPCRLIGERSEAAIRR